MRLFCKVKVSFLEYKLKVVFKILSIVNWKKTAQLSIVFVSLFPVFHPLTYEGGVDVNRYLRVCKEFST